MKRKLTRDQVSEQPLNYFKKKMWGKISPAVTIHKRGKPRNQTSTDKEELRTES